MATLLQLAELLKEVRTVDGDCSVQKLMVFLYVASCGDIGTDHATLQNKLAISKSQASKLVADWSAIQANKDHGPDLMSSTIDPMNNRVRIIRLTETGRKFANKLRDIIA